MSISATVVPRRSSTGWWVPRAERDRPHLVVRLQGQRLRGDRISALLGVRYVLQGSVRKAGDQLRISAQLLDAGGRQVWNQSFDRQLENIFEIQSEIAGAVATTVASHVTAQPDTGHQPDLEAYEHYLTGRTLLHLREMHRAQAEFERAVGIDPEFAEAHAELAIAQALSGTQEKMDRARGSGERALQLKPGLLRARAAQGFVLMASDPPDSAGASGRCARCSHRTRT